MNKKDYRETINGPWVTWDSRNDVQIRTVLNGRTLIIDWQGSISTKDWIINFTFFPKIAKPFKEMEIPFFSHKGFDDSYDSVKDALYDFIHKHNINKIVNRGYSQGAAYAIRMHEDYKFRGFDITTRAYAPPRVFWFWNLRKIKERFEGLTLIINHGDIVTHLPFIIMGFRHVGKKEYIGKWYHTLLPRVKRHLYTDYIKYLPE